MQAAAIARLGGAELARALRAGIHRLQREREHLDRINVFPVPDGDTGTNLALSMGAVLPVLTGPAVAHAGQLLTQVADAALDGARGNSGAILAQFFLGVGDHAGALAELSPAQFAGAVAGGASYARDALTAPREGTILTVLSAVGAELERAARQVPGDFRALLARGREAGRRALDETRSQLDELTRADVVDAGAAGFVALLEGFGEYLETGILDESAPPLPAEVGAADVAGGEAGLEHRWCTECSVAGADIDRRQLRERLAPFGSSLVIAGSARKVRVHVHTNEPARVFATAAEFGTVSGEKADDMQRQQESALHASRRQVAIVTDTGGDIPDEELERLDIHVVPARVHFGEHSYLDKVGLSPEEFWRLVATSPHHPKTSQPPVGDFRRMFEFLSSHYAHVISVNATGRATGTRQAAESAAARIEAHARVRVFDSLNACGGEGLLAIHAAECADAGLGPEAILARLAALRSRTRTFGYLPTLEFGMRGGRVPVWAGRLSALLAVTPYLAIRRDGRIAIGGVLWGRGDLKAKFARMLARHIDPGRRYRLIISHGNVPEDGRWLLQHLRTAHASIERAWLLPLGPAVGVHAGPGALLVSLQEAPPEPAGGGVEAGPAR